ncbi:MAG: hypothetical protein EAZ97_09665, partial [Bacteroidetes bacterium]
DKKEKEYYDAQQKRYLDESSRIQEAVEKAVKEAIEKAVAQTVEQTELNRNVEVAKNAIKKGANNDFIADITGLTVKQIEQLRSETK